MQLVLHLPSSKKFPPFNAFVMNCALPKNLLQPAIYLWAVSIKWLAESSLNPVRTLLSFCCVLFFLPGLACAAANVTVLYPEVPAPYKSVFDSILQGIKSKNGIDIKLYPLDKNYQLEILQQDIKENQTEGLIALGKRGYWAAHNLKTDLQTVVGALPLVPNGISGISFSADPEQLFARLKLLVPDSKKVFVVYSPQTTGWLIPLAEAAANKHQLELVAYPADTLREAMLHYRRLLNEANGRNNAIWLPLDKVTANEDIVLPLLLRNAWDKNLSIFSSKPTHVQRGVLFSLYPDNFGLGQELANLMKEQIELNQSPKVYPLKKLFIAVNMRTAAHLGLTFSPQQQQDFKLTFPSR